MVAVIEKAVDSPLKPGAARKFLNARSSREENQQIVRNLLRGVGVETVTAEAARTGVAAALSRFDDSPERFDPDPGRYSGAFARLIGPAAERESRPATMLEWQVSPEPGAPARSNAS